MRKIFGRVVRSEKGVGMRQEQRLRFAVAAALTFGSSFAAQAKAPPPPQYAAILVSPQTGETLFAQNADLMLHPASITKMMTLYLAFQGLAQGKLSLNDMVTFSRHAADQRPSKIGLAPGKSIRLDTLIRLIAVKSANDGAVALAEHIDGTEAAFAAHMTREAKRIGMRNTQFVNASGLSNPGQLTTARDIATLATTIIRHYPQQYRYFATRNFDYGTQSFTNHNHLLGKVPGVDGIKTGFTVDAGYTLAASAERQGSRLIAVVLGARSAKTRDMDVVRLLDLGFSQMGRGQQVAIADQFKSTGASLPDVKNPGDTEQGSADASSTKPRKRHHRASTKHLASR
jgi:D-alanyl-D-alanine carboxypeptidase